jgi:hypothetical protein
MSKVYNKIVQSNTEPSKNDIWLKDGQMKTFGKEGWKSVGGGSSLDANTPYIFDYIGQATVTQDEYDGLKNAINNNNRILISSIEGIAEPTIKGIDYNIIVLIYTKPGATIMFTIDDTLNLSIDKFVYADSAYFNEEIIALKERISALEDATA